MTQDQQDSLIAKALSQPELLTAEEADAIMADPGLRQLLSAAALLKGAAQPAPECDVDAEWQAFRSRVSAGKKRKNALWRAAAIIAVAIGVAAAFFAVRPGHSLDDIALIDTIFPLRDTLVLVVKAEPAPIADVPVMPVHTEQAAGLLSQHEPDSLIIQARVDNEIALMRAECYRQIAAAKDVDLPEDFPVTVPDFPIDGATLSMLTAE